MEGGWVNWVVRAGERRRTRFHDYEGHPIRASELRDLPVVLVEGARRKLTRAIPPQPWIPYPAIRRLAVLLRPEWRVLEYGSGASTVWLATRAQRITSIEHDRRWYKLICAALGPSSYSVDYRLIDSEADGSAYWRLSGGDEQAFDLVIVDGIHRAECMRSAVIAVRPGGLIYLDNIDSAGRDAYAILSDAVSRVGGTIELFTGFPPAQLTVSTGALARLGAAGSFADGVRRPLVGSSAPQRGALGLLRGDEHGGLK
jgi:predicted O-methyltransferase YrrM